MKVWDRRDYKDLDDAVELGTRNIKLALRRLRRFARDGAPTSSTSTTPSKRTADKAAGSTSRWCPERHNIVKVLLLLDVGGSMDDHIRECEELFSAARSRVQAPGVLLLPQCLYESCGRNNRRRFKEHFATARCIRTYGRTTR